METKSIVQVAVAVLVAVLVFTAILVPVVSEFSEAEHSYTNEGVTFAEVESGTHEIIVTNDGQTKMTVDGKAIDISKFTAMGGESYSILIFDNAFARVSLATATDQFRVVTTEYVDSIAMTSGTSVTITVDGSTVTIVEPERTRTLENCKYYVSSEGQFVMAKNPVVTAESVIVGAGQTYFSAWNSNIFMEWYGTGEDINANVFRSNGFDATPTDPTITVSKTNVKEAAYRIDNISFDFDSTVSGAAVHPVCNYNYFLAPKVVTWDNEKYMGATSDLVGIIPIIVIVGLLISVIGIAIVRRYDL